MTRTEARSGCKAEPQFWNFYENHEYEADDAGRVTRVARWSAYRGPEPIAPPAPAEESLETIATYAYQDSATDWAVRIERPGTSVQYLYVEGDGLPWKTEYYNAAGDTLLLRYTLTRDANGRIARVVENRRDPASGAVLAATTDYAYGDGRIPGGMLDGDSTVNIEPDKLQYSYAPPAALQSGDPNRLVMERRYGDAGMAPFFKDAFGRADVKYAVHTVPLSSSFDRCGDQVYFEYAVYPMSALQDGGSPTRLVSGATTITYPCYNGTVSNDVLHVQGRPGYILSSFSYAPGGALRHHDLGGTYRTNDDVAHGYLSDLGGNHVGTASGGMEVTLQVADAFGNVIAAPMDRNRMASYSWRGPEGTENDFQYNEHYLWLPSYTASTGLYQMGDRFYDPTIGRFIRADRVLLGGIIPTAANRYAYSLDDPVNYTDPDGLQTYSEQVGTTQINSVLVEMATGAEYREGIKMTIELVETQTGRTMLYDAIVKAGKVLHAHWKCKPPWPLPPLGL